MSKINFVWQNKKWKITHFSEVTNNLHVHVLLWLLVTIYTFLPTFCNRTYIRSQSWCDWGGCHATIIITGFGQKQGQVEAHLTVIDILDVAMYSHRHVKVHTMHALRIVNER